MEIRFGLRCNRVTWNSRFRLEGGSSRAPQRYGATPGRTSGSKPNNNRVARGSSGLLQSRRRPGRLQRRTQLCADALERELGDLEMRARGIVSRTGREGAARRALDDIHEAGPLRGEGEASGEIGPRAIGSRRTGRT